MEPHTIYISLGSNLGDRKVNLEEAIEQMTPEISLVSCSKTYETPPWGYEDQANFLNQVVRAHTELTPHDLLGKLKNIEKLLGRQPTFRYGPRLIDLDILFYDNSVIQTDELTIPHPEIVNRAFVLVPMREIAPDFIHPATKKTITELASNVITKDILIYHQKKIKD